MNQTEIIHPRQPIILLDLNYTLVANNPARGTTPVRMDKRLANEQYRQWLVDGLGSPRIVGNLLIS